MVRATVLFEVRQALDMGAAMDWPWTETVATATSLIYTDGTHRLNFRGSFTYDAEGRVSGTVTMASYFLGDTVQFDAYNLSLSASVMQTFTETVGDTQATYAYMLAGGENISGSRDDDVLIGYGGNDFISGGTGDDRIYGGSGNDTMSGGNFDTLVGGTGDDWYYAYGATVVESVGGGIDKVYAWGNYTLGANVERLKLWATEPMNGIGNELANVLVGNDQVNILVGGARNDVLAGEGGNDILWGGTGRDLLTGGSGLDSFRFDRVAHATTNTDRISDFSHADDTIVLYASAYAGIGAAGVLASTAFRASTAAGDAGDRVIYDAATGHLYFDADGTGAAAQVLFATVSPNSGVASNDFLIA